MEKECTRISFHDYCAENYIRPCFVTDLVGSQATQTLLIIFERVGFR